MRVAVHFNPEKNNAPECAGKVCEILLGDGAEVSVSPVYKERFSNYSGIEFAELADSVSVSDFVIAIGGDGTMRADSDLWQVLRRTALKNFLI